MPRLEALEDRCVLINPTVLDPNLGLRTVVSGLVTPTTMTFLGDNDFFVLEKSTGKVDHVVNGVNEATRFDFGAGPINNLPVNNNSERGLLGITLSPNFTTDHDVFLYWTESSTGAVSANVAETPVLGNRVDRFIWNAVTSTLTFDRNIIRLHSFQNDGNGGNPNQMQGNHNGGVIKFGPDGKLYIAIGDNGRRGWTQNLVNGPNGPGQTDENNGPVRGGPAPDDAHLTGVLLRLNPDGSAPSDNPFVDISASFQAPLLSGPDTAGRQSLGSFFTAFLNQAHDTFSVDIGWENLGGPTLPGGAFVTLGGVDGPAIFAIPDLPGGLTAGSLTTTLTTANFIAEPAFGINTFADAVNAVVGGKASFNIYTRQFPGGAVSGQIGHLDPSVTTNLHKIYAYGIRNTFGFDWDPVTGKLWLEENGDQSFDKISIVGPGANNGWVQSSAPLFNIDGTLDDTALAEFKSIELALSPNGPQQTRWPSANIADTPQEALNRLLMLPGAYYNPAVFSVRAEFPPAGLGFLTSSALGSQYQNVLFEGEARDFLTAPTLDLEFDGALLFFHPNSDRTGLDFGDNPNIRASDHVFLNNRDLDLNGDTSLLFGIGFGIGTDIVTGPNGNLYVVSETKGAVYEIFRKDAVAPFLATDLVADTATPHDSTGQALAAPVVVDPNLKNPWGISLSATSPFWVANQRSGTATLYAGDVVQPDGSRSPFTMNSLVVTVPSPTGTVFNGTTGFLLSNGQPARFIFDGTNGTISAWNGGTQAEVKATIPGAVYTGLDMGSTAAGDFLYAANMSQGRIDVFNTNFQLVTPGPAEFVFSDPNLPQGLTPYRPFNIDNIDGTLYVTYRNSADPEHGGIVDAFDTDGHFLRRVVSGGVNAPWGLTLAPEGFGPFGGALLVGNFGLGDGKINAYDPNTGQFLGYLTNADGNPLAFEGLWYLSFGNGGSGGDPNTLYFTAGINRTGAGSFGAADGLFGSIQFVNVSSTAVLPGRGVAVALGGPAGSTVFGQEVTLTAIVTPTDPNAGPPTGTVVFMDGATVLGSADLDASGQAVFTTSALLPGDHAITAVYTGDADFDPASSVALTQTVTKAQTTTTLTSSDLQAILGESVTLTVQVAALAPSSATPTGTVTLMEDDTVLGKAQVDANGQAVFVLDSLPVGTHRLTASLLDSDLFASSVSDILEQTITP
jgi:uncharacterized protein (TIGR03118 family)